MGNTAASAGEGPPADLIALERGTRSVGLRVDAGAYPVAAIYGAAYLFLDRCWVVLDRPDAAHVRVTLRSRRPEGELDGSALAAEFAEELVSSTWRAAIAKETRSLIDSAVARAHAGGDAPPSLDELASYEFAKDAMEDPLGLAASWEEKHKAREASEQNEKNEKRED
jgi:His-Xaa-Ser system protein HxsD